MNERLAKIMLHYGLSIEELSEKTGFTRQAVRSLLRENKDMRLLFIQRIIIAYPEISAEWLLVGRGEMLTSPNAKLFQPSQPD